METQAQKSRRLALHRARYEKDNKKNRERWKTDAVWREKRQREARERGRRLTTNQKGVINERACARRWLARQHLLRSAWPDKELETSTVILLQELMHPMYVVVAPGRRPEYERWPPEDDAQKWLNEHSGTMETVVTKHVTTPPTCGTVTTIYANRPLFQHTTGRGHSPTVLLRAFAAKFIINFRSLVKIVMEPVENGASIQPTQAQIDDESRRIRRLRILVQLTLESIAAGDLTPEEASGMIAATRRVALEMFPGKERAFDLLYRPKFQRVMHAIYRLQ
jgi:hypothetical protein